MRYVSDRPARFILYMILIFGKYFKIHQYIFFVEHAYMRNIKLLNWKCQRGKWNSFLHRKIQSSDDEMYNRIKKRKSIRQIGLIDFFVERELIVANRKKGVEKNKGQRENDCALTWVASISRDDTGFAGFSQMAKCVL